MKKGLEIFYFIPKYVMQTLLLLLAAALRLAVAVMQHHYSFEDRETCSFVVLLCSYERYTILELGAYKTFICRAARNINRIFTTGLSYVSFSLRRL